MWTNAHSPSFPDATAVDLDSIFWSRYSSCINQSFPGSPNDKAEKAKMAQTCWEHWDAATMLEFLQKQSGPGGAVHISNGDMLGDKKGGCGELTIDGNRFVDPAQRPEDFDEYFAAVVNQTRLANALLPSGAPKHKVIWYLITAKLSVYL